MPIEFIIKSYASFSTWVLQFNSFISLHKDKSQVISVFLISRADLNLKLMYGESFKFLNKVFQ